MIGYNLNLQKFLIKFQKKLMGLEEAHVNLQGISKSFGDPAHEPIWR